MTLSVQHYMRDDVALARREGQSGGALMRTAAASVVHHVMRAVGAALGARAERLPPRLGVALSLESRA